MRSSESVTETATYDSGFDSAAAIALEAAAMNPFLSESLAFVFRINDGSPGSDAGSTVVGEAAEAATGALRRGVLHPPRRRPRAGADSTEKRSSNGLG